MYISNKIDKIYIFQIRYIPISGDQELPRHHHSINMYI